MTRRTTSERGCSAPPALQGRRWTALSRCCRALLARGTGRDQSRVAHPPRREHLRSAWPTRRCSAPLPRGCLNGAPRQVAALGRAAPLCLPAQPPIGPSEHHSGPRYHLPAVLATAPTWLGVAAGTEEPGRAVAKSARAEPGCRCCLHLPDGPCCSSSLGRRYCGRLWEHFGACSCLSGHCLAAGTGQRLCTGAEEKLPCFVFSPENLRLTEFCRGFNWLRFFLLFFFSLGD